MKTVLFVCVGNSARSQMAEGFFNAAAPEGWQAVSAGTHPASSVSRAAVEVMAEKGIDLSKARPKELTREMVEEADMVISMGCGVDLCPYNLYDGVVDWGLDDPTGAPVERVREIRDEIERKVRDLLDRIQGQAK
ncbi:MAG: arsenate reductase ArsC [Methanobacteriota archaeon]|nr:MAG: arsenate reductase ArsC [Euryarchaeota archaeon]